MIRWVFERLLDVVWGRSEGPSEYVSPTTGKRHW